MAFIWKDKGAKTWWLDWTPPGGKRKRKRIGKSKQAAQLALKDVEHRLSFDRAGVADPSMTLGQFFGDYESTVMPTLRDPSQKRYGEVMQHFRAFHGPRWESMRLGQITQQMVEQYVAWRRAGNSGFEHRAPSEDDPPKSKTVNTELDILGTIFNKAVDWNLLGTSPVKRVRRLREDDRKPFRHFSLDEIALLRLIADAWDAGETEEQIRDQVRSFYESHTDLDPWSGDDDGRPPARRRTARLPQARLTVDFLLGTGAREDELLEIEWSWLDIRRRVAEFRRCQVWRPGGQRVLWVPKGTEGSVQFKPELAARLAAAKRRRNCPKVFTDASGKPIPARTLERQMGRLIELARVQPATLHDFRHTYASHLAMAGVPLPTIQRLLRHKNIQTVMIYAHLCPRHVEEASGQLPY